MFVQNFTFIKGGVFICSKKVGEYLISRNIPQLSRDGDKFIFSKTDLLDEIVETLPEEYREEDYEYK